MYLLMNGMKMAADAAQTERKLRMIDAVEGQANGERYVQVTEEEDRLFMMDLFGGLPEVYFPNTAAALERTDSMAEKEGINALVGDVSQEGFTDAVLLKGVYDDGDRIRFEGEAVVVDFVRQMTLELDVYEPDNGEGRASCLLAEGEQFFSFAADRIVTADTSVSKEKLLGRECGVFLAASWVTEDGILKTKTKVVNLGDVLSDEHMLASVHVDDPAWKRERPQQEDEPVIVCYNRTPHSEDEYDYLLNFSGDNFYVPVKGNAVFADKSQTFDRVLTTGLSGSSSCLMLIRRDGGAFSFQNEAGKDFAQFFSLFKEEGTGMPGFQWDFKKVRWASGIPIPSVEIIQMDFNLTVDYYVKNSAKKHTMILYSGDRTAGDNQKVSRLQMYWGCLYRDTMVTMEDGSRMAIQEIEPGQSVRTPGGSAVVRELVTGNELRGIYRLTTCADGDGGKKELYLTAEHPLMTDQGVRMLHELTSYTDDMGQVAYREKIASEDGEYERICSVDLAIVTDNTVYNLVLGQEAGQTDEEDGLPLFYANGLLVGDNNLQAREVQRQMEELRREHGLPEAWQPDVQSAERFFRISQEGNILWKK